jgi:hypothetical protein
VAWKKSFVTTRTLIRIEAGTKRYKMISGAFNTWK